MQYKILASDYDNTLVPFGAVSYTHLDVYKRQVGAAAWRFRSEDELAETLTLTGQLPYSDGK